MELKDRLILLREKAGLDQATFAFACGWSKSRYSHYENGRREPKLADLQHISSVLEQYLGPHAIVFLVTGESLNDIFKHQAQNQQAFTPDIAINEFKKLLDDAIEFGLIKIKPGVKISSLIENFTKNCMKHVIQSSSEKSKSG
ncbi:helix-turn-helix domain-containing protein [Alteromonas sp. a30]|uniref:helix-turn-helix domain-containing protein n=1 Tax=Alteromonas sp. a30 TaxID=2730917 RepID=UPI0022820A7D|nr:helix-turn-helix transcriptional regulator [Alteromonas sp. a30]MCY7295114.1 helix-turn-helix transcriptional regulator [Alteromonas sp. a30]